MFIFSDKCLFFLTLFFGPKLSRKSNHNFRFRSSERENLIRNLKRRFEKNSNKTKILKFQKLFTISFSQ